MNKKILIISSVVLLIFLLCLLGYYFIIYNNTPGTKNGGLGGFKSFLPFGGDGNTNTDNSTTTPETPRQDNTNTQNFTQKLRKLSSEPVAGAGSLDTKVGTLVRYIEKATGHIFEVEMYSPRTARISNTTIPVVYDAMWSGKMDSLVTRYLDDDDETILTYFLSIKNISTSTENTISGSELPKNIADVSVNGDSMFYLLTNENSSSGYVGPTDGTKRKQVWGSDIKELLSQYINPKFISLTTKSAQGVWGYMYLIDTGTGTSKRILGDISGLSTLTDNTAENVLYLEQNDTARLYSYDIKNKKSTYITPSTFPEKCVWSKKEKNTAYCAVPKDSISAQSLTLWYKGEETYSDDIWKYDTKNNTATTIEDLFSDSKEEIDVIKPTLSENEQYLIFINKKDNSLWSLDLLQ